MLSYYELANLGLCPEKGYGWMKQLPKDFKLPEIVQAHIFKQMPLQLQVRYEQYPGKDCNFHMLRELS